MMMKLDPTSEGRMHSPTCRLLKESRAYFVNHHWCTNMFTNTRDWTYQGHLLQKCTAMLQISKARFPENHLIPNSRRNITICSPSHCKEGSKMALTNKKAMTLAIGTPGNARTKTYCSITDAIKRERA
ncbi:hypothetical protein DPMN_008655 [Dreissena polymorpha]|uniref:Uncharacterized protein n=1 Tax=Dreissena polymorpha TaxID=45954 RepID=A0A9D4RXJ3_DREPO|nr:hypothetical protein DPMN_008655 [Dreissena polymorpha]